LSLSRIETTKLDVSKTLWLTTASNRGVTSPHISAVNRSPLFPQSAAPFQTGKSQTQTNILREITLVLGTG
jgi:hypothetical protein